MYKLKIFVVLLYSKVTERELHVSLIISTAHCKICTMKTH